MRTRALVVGTVALVVAGACGGGDGDGGGGRTLRIGAAASLTEAFTELVERYEAANDVDVELSFASSTVIATQANDLAPFDVVATADVRSMASMVDSGTVAEPKVFARNGLAIAVETGNPEGIAGVADLGREGLIVVLCSTDAPCGRYADAALAAAGVEVEAASREENVKGVVAKVALGEADAGIVYASDVRDGNVDAVAIPEQAGGTLSAQYPIAVTTTSAQPGLAGEFVEFVLSAEGRDILADHGFLDP